MVSVYSTLERACEKKHIHQCELLRGGQGGGGGGGGGLRETKANIIDYFHKCHQ